MHVNAAVSLGSLRMTNFAASGHSSLLNVFESLSDAKERCRNRFLPCKDASEAELVCPKPCRAGSGNSTAPFDSSAKPSRRLRGTTSLPVVGEAGCEILDILYSKVDCGDNSISGSPNKYLIGSPPCRANNPMIHDNQFSFKRTVSSSLIIPLKSSCGSSSLGGSGSAKSNSSVKSICRNSPYVPKPFIRIEGFASSTQDSNRGIPAYA